MDKIYQLYGESMFPTIKSGDKVILEEVSLDKIRIKDMLIYKKNQLYICHRLIKKEDKDGKSLFYMKGDFGNKIDIISAEKIFGRTKAIIHKGKITDTAFMTGWFYIAYINIICFLKNAAVNILCMFYNKKSACRLLNGLFPLQISYEFIKDISLNDDFKSFYRLTLPDYSDPLICFGFLARADGYPAAKIWVMKNSQGQILIYGPYVRVLYRRRGIGRQILEHALVQIKKEFNAAEVYSVINFHLLPKRCQKQECLHGYMKKVPLLNLLSGFEFSFHKYGQAALFMRHEIKSSV